MLQFLDAHKFSSANVKFSSTLLSQYIQDLVKQGELGSWSVAVMGSKQGNPIELPNGQRVNRVERSVLASSLSDRDPQARYLSALSPPEDELIDLDDMVPKTIRTVVDFRSLSDGMKRSCSSIRQELRPNSRGLILLYPLDVGGSGLTEAGKTENSERDDSRVPGKLSALKCNQNVFGVTFVFPKSHRTTGRYRYIVNGTV